MIQQSNQQKLFYYSALLLSSLLLLIPAFYNHYPLFDPDAATYISSGFLLETPIDRPIIYGLLLRILSLNGLTLWLPVLAQTLIVSWLIFRIIRTIVGDATYLIYSLITILFLSLFTTLSWTVSSIHPDIFTPVCCLSVLLLLAGNEVGKTRVCLFILFFVSITVHMSHPLMFSGLAICLFLMKRLFLPSYNYRKTGVTVAVLVGLSLSGIIFMGSALSKSKHVFFVGSLLQKGVLPVYLHEVCDKKAYKLCAYRDELPKTSDEFVWLSYSPLYKVGGSWPESKQEFNEISYDILTTPRYLGMFITAAFKQLGEQLVLFRVGDGNFSFPPGTNLNMQLSQYIPREQTMFNHAYQNNVKLQERVVVLNTFFAWIIFLSVVILPVLIITAWKKMGSMMRGVIILSVVGYVVNCADYATFSTTSGRYGYKMVWMLVFSVIVCFFDIINRKKKATSSLHRQS